MDTLYATFLAISRGIGETPPSFDVLYETRNLGASWTPVAPPKGYSGGDLGGIYVDTAAHDAVVALYGHSVTNAQIDGALGTDDAAIATTDGGATWHQFPIACPAVGPCLRFGGMPDGIPSMGTFNLQPLMRSSDHGRNWTTISWPSGNTYQIEFPGQAEIASIGGSKVLFIDASSQYPVRLSRDGGRTWLVIGVPLPPKTKANVRYGNLPYGTLMLLRDGTLLAGVPPDIPGVTTRWWTLAPGAQHWRPQRAVPGLMAPATFGRLLLCGNRLYWQRLDANGLPQVNPAGLESAPLP